MDIITEIKKNIRPRKSDIKTVNEANKTSIYEMFGLRKVIVENRLEKERKAREDLERRLKEIREKEEEFKKQEEERIQKIQQKQAEEKELYKIVEEEMKTENKFETLDPELLQALNESKLLL